MRTYIVSYIATGLVLAIADAIWLSMMSNILYRPLIGDLLLERFNFAPAIVFYLLYTAGIVVFAVSPAFVSGRWTTALASGAMLGFLCYATYDLTNQATLRGWSTIVTMVDIAWGTTLTAVAAALGYLGANAALKVMDS